MEYHPNKQIHYKKVGKKISKTLKGHSVSDSAREKQSKSHTGWFDRLSKQEQDEYRMKLSNKMKEVYKNGHHSKGKKLKESHKQKLSERAKENNFGGDTWCNLSKDAREIRSKKISNSMKGRILSVETKKKISNSLKNRNKNV